MTDHRTITAAQDELGRVITAWPARQWTREAIREYREAMAEAGTVKDIRAGVTKAIRSWAGSFPPDVASLCDLIAEERRARTRAARAFTDSTRPDHEAPPWHGPLWEAAALVAMRSAVRPRLARYAEIVERLGLRPVHGIPFWRDARGRPSGENPDYRPDLVRQAIEEAHVAWEAEGADPDANAKALRGILEGADHRDAA